MAPASQPPPKRGFRPGGAAGLMLWALLGTLSSCQAEPGLHRTHDVMAIARAFYGSPIVGRALFWIGEGDIPNYGASLQGYYFPTDRLAVGIGVDRIEFCPEGENFGGWEIEARLRYYIAEVEDMAAFFDLNGGWLGAEEEMPEGGTKSNFTFSFGPGLEVLMGSGFSLLAGCEFHHWSNARGTGERATDNPAQNEYFPWLGVGFKW